MTDTRLPQCKTKQTTFSNRRDIVLHKEIGVNELNADVKITASSLIAVSAHVLWKYG